MLIIIPCFFFFFFFFLNLFSALLTHQRKRYNKLKEDYDILTVQCIDLEQEIRKLEDNKKKGPSKIPFPTVSFPFLTAGIKLVLLFLCSMSLKCFILTFI